MPKQSLAELTALPELGSTSESEQMYLITVARAIEAGAMAPVSISKIAAALRVSVPSANEMVRKLDSRGLLIYEPYHGARLSDAGRYLANQVLRTRRLWATFLADHLGFSPTEADDQACHLEHATTAEAADRLAGFLGNPSAGPLGQPIPDNDMTTEKRRTLVLADVAVGIPVEVISVAADGATAEFLKSEGVSVGARLEVIGFGGSGLLIEVGNGVVHLTAGLLRGIEVLPVEANDASA
jgi:DtxR family Mn-dependent transcriptional regulator